VLKGGSRRCRAGIKAGVKGGIKAGVGPVSGMWVSPLPLHTHAVEWTSIVGRAQTCIDGYNINGRE
jgi:hypothetical protein